jgi:general secretion pathway protein L
MTDKLIVQLLPPVSAADDAGRGVVDCAAQWLRLAGEGSPGAPVPGEGKLSGLLQQAPGNCQWIVLVPGEDVLTTTVRLPRKRRRQAIKALPYMLEDSVASDVTQEHVAIGPDNADGATLVAVTRSQRLRDLLGTFADAGITPHRVIPDYAMLKDQPDSWQILLAGDRAMVRRPDGTGFSTPVSRLALLLDAGRDPEKDVPGGELQCFRAADMGLPALPGNWQVSEQVIASPIQHLAAAAAETSLNLLQGEFKVVQQGGWNWRSWAAAAVLALVALGIGLLETGLETARYNRENEQLQASMMALARDALPGVTQIRDPQTQLLIAWRQLKTGGAGEAEFLPLLNRVSPVISQQQVTVQGISFKDGTLTMALEGSSLQQLDDLRQQIEQQGLEASLINAGTDADSARSSLVIKAGARQQPRGAG